MSLSAQRQPASAGERANLPVRVMVVDDSVVIRGLVSRWLAEEPGIEVVAKCSNGAIAVDAVAAAAPHVIVLDIEMPVMDGLTALPKLLEGARGVKVIVASTLTKRNAAVSLKALSLGAADCLPKPEGNSGVTTSIDFRRDLLAKVRALGGLDRPELRPVVAPGGSATRAPSTVSHMRHEADGRITLQPFLRGIPRVLAIGSSTGGPQALTRVLGDLGSAIDRIPCFITQHMPPTFTAILADNLGRTSGIPTKEAAEGDVARPGHIYVAPGGKHLIVKKRGMEYLCHLDDGPPVNFTKPSVDLMFNSIASAYGGGILGVVLTGMGADGAAGAGTIRAAGGNVIAQNEATSVVWGMPGAVAESGHCSAVLPIEKIGPEIQRICRGALR